MTKSHQRSSCVSADRVKKQHNRDFFINGLIWVNNDQDTPGAGDSPENVAASTPDYQSDSEGATVNSIPFSFLSFFNILNIIWDDRRRNGKSAIVEGLRESLLYICDPQAVKRLKVLKKQKHAIPEYLYQSGRCAIEHAHWDSSVDPDELEHLHRLSEDRSIIRAVARYLIETKYGISDSICG